MAKGYDYEFTSEVPNEYKCPECKKVLRDPHRVSCCDEEYCKACITPLLLGNRKTCPQCRELANIAQGKKTKRHIYQLRCRCSNRREGCGWEGKVCEVDGHLNKNPTKKENQLKGCDYTKVQCLYCRIKLPRNEIGKHQENVCQHRQVNCQYCIHYDTYQRMVAIHLPKCPQQPVKCPHGCGLSPQRKNLATHKAEECPKAMVKCEIQGCEEKRQRKDMPAHMEEYLVHHVQLLSKIVRELQAEKRQREEAEQARQLPISMTVTDVQQCLETKKEWTSPLLYTHERGYAIQLKVYVAGHRIAGLRNEISVYVEVIRGQYDDQLQWPCRVSIEVSLINQEQDGENVTRVANIQARKDGQNHSEGWQMFIGEKNARHRFIKDDCLQFKISKIN